MFRISVHTPTENTAYMLVNAVERNKLLYMKHVSTLCGQNVEFFNVTAGGIYSNHCALKG